MKCIDRAMWSYLHTLCLKLGQQRLQLLAQLPGGQIRKMCEEHCQAHMVCPIGLQCATAQGQALRLLRGSICGSQHRAVRGRPEKKHKVGQGDGLKHQLMLSGQGCERMID